MFKISKKTIILINTITSYNILASNGKFTFQNFNIHEMTKKKIYKLKNYSVFKENINKHFKDYNTLNFKQIQEYINKLPNCKKIEIFDYLEGKDIKNIYIIAIKKDPDEVFLQRKKCTLYFDCKSYELEDKFKKPIEIEFSETVNDETNIVDYIKNTYKVKSFSDDDFSIKDKKSDLILPFPIKHLSDGEYTIELNKHVEGITKKKEDDDLIFNISLKVNDQANFKLKNNITSILQFTLKKNSTYDDLTKYLKDSHGIETDWILSIFDDKNHALSAGTAPLKGGSYVLIFKDSENNFVEKIKEPSNKDITLKILPKDETNYKLKGISSDITINVPENISYNNLVNEVKKTITDGKFEIYVDNNKVENGNININKQIVIKLLDGCNKLKDNKGDGDGDGNEGGDNNNNTDNNNTQTKQKKYYEGKCGKK